MSLGLHAGERERHDYEDLVGQVGAHCHFGRGAGRSSVTFCEGQSGRLTPAYTRRPCNGTVNVVSVCLSVCPGCLLLQGGRRRLGDGRATSESDIGAYSTHANTVCLSYQRPKRHANKRPLVPGSHVSKASLPDEASQYLTCVAGAGRCPTSPSTSASRLPASNPDCLVCVYVCMCRRPFPRQPARPSNPSP